jgi:hypothetical protein
VIIIGNSLSVVCHMCLSELLKISNGISYFHYLVLSDILFAGFATALTVLNDRTWNELHELAPCRCSGRNECLDGTANCSQICVDRPISYECRCKRGYQLSNNSHTCEG